jgi:hypothetical protein
MMPAAEGVLKGGPVLMRAEEVVVREVLAQTSEGAAAREHRVEEEGRREELKACGTWAEEEASCRWAAAASSLPAWEEDPAGRGWPGRHRRGPWEQIPSEA